MTGDAAHRLRVKSEQAVSATNGVDAWWSNVQSGSDGKAVRRGARHSNEKFREAACCGAALLPAGRTALGSVAGLGEPQRESTSYLILQAPATAHRPRIWRGRRASSFQPDSVSQGPSIATTVRGAMGAILAQKLLAGSRLPS